MTTYVHKDSRWDTGRHRPTSWHIVKAPLAHARTFATFCGREFVTDDLMTETPDAATCEVCFRYEAKARERADARWLPAPDMTPIEDDGSTAPIDAPDVP